MLGPEDAFFNQLAALARVLPVLPLFGGGEVKLQPVYVGDVAEAVAKPLATEDAKGRTYELVHRRIRLIHRHGALKLAAQASSGGRIRSGQTRVNLLNAPVH
jgi:uncharacterized protein YbjT (DUF2867 family)